MTEGDSDEGAGSDDGPDGRPDREPDGSTGSESGTPSDPDPDPDHDEAVDPGTAEGAESSDGENDSAKDAVDDAADAGGSDGEEVESPDPMTVTGENPDPPEIVDPDAEDVPEAPGGARPNEAPMDVDPPDPEVMGTGGDPGGGAGVTSGAPDDEEMPLADHIEEMVRRLGVVVVVMAIVSAVVFPFADRLINFLWYSFLPGSPDICGPIAAAAANASDTAANASAALSGAPNGTVVRATLPNGTALTATLPDPSFVTATYPRGTVLRTTFPNGTAGNVTLAGPVADPAAVNAACPRLYHPLALVFARLKMASLAGFVVGLPVFVYETYLFMRPGLYPNERRYYLSSVPTSLVLAAVGIGFAYFLVLPIIFTYFLGYSQPVAEIAFGLSDTFDLILLMLGMFALIFQIPLFVMLAIMMGVTTRRWLESRRLYFWFGFAGVAFIFSPDPTGMAPFIVALTMILLFEGTLLLLRWTGR